jgi:hypothetical protein
VGADAFTYDDERMCLNPSYKAVGLGTSQIPPPATYINEHSKTGIGSMKGVPGIPNPMLPIASEFMLTGKLPLKMLKSNFFKIAMGEGGSALGKYADNDPYHPGQKLTDWPLKW